MAVSEDDFNKSRMFTHHGKKKNQGKWARINNKPALTFTVGESEEVVGYTTIDEMIQMAYATDLPEIELDF